MQNLIEKYKAIPYEKRTRFFAIITTFFTGIAAIVKIFLGISSELLIFISGCFSILLVFAKIECLIGIYRKEKTSSLRTFIIFLSVFIASVLYIVFLSKELTSTEVEDGAFGNLQSIILLIVAIVEIIIAILGFKKLSFSGTYYRNIKLINIIFAITSLATAEFAVLSFITSKDLDDIMLYTGLVVGTISLIISTIIYTLPYKEDISKIERMYNLVDKNKNSIVEFSNSNQQSILLYKNKLFGSLYFVFIPYDNYIKGHIHIDESALKSLNKNQKIIFYLTIWMTMIFLLFYYGYYFIHVLLMYLKLHFVMTKNGFIKIQKL